MNKKNFDVLGILLGVVLGFMLGFFINSRIGNEETDKASIVGANEKEVYGNVYLLQLAKFDNPSGTDNFIKSLKEKLLDGVYVLEDDYYYVYGAIRSSKSELIELQNTYELNGFKSIIKKDYILDQANIVIEDDNIFNFWNDGINNLVKNVNGQSIYINEEFYDDPYDLEFLSKLTMLKNIKNEKLINIVRLQLYKDIKEKIK